MNTTVAEGVEVVGLVSGKNLYCSFTGARVKSLWVLCSAGVQKQVSTEVLKEIIKRNLLGEGYNENEYSDKLYATIDAKIQALRKSVPKIKKGE